MQPLLHIFCFILGWIKIISPIHEVLSEQLVESLLLYLQTVLILFKFVRQHATSFLFIEYLATYLYSQHLQLLQDRFDSRLHLNLNLLELCKLGLRLGCLVLRNIVSNLISHPWQLVLVLLQRLPKGRRFFVWLLGRKPRRLIRKLNRTFGSRCFFGPYSSGPLNLITFNLLHITLFRWLYNLSCSTMFIR